MGNGSDFAMLFLKRIPQSVSEATRFSVAFLSFVFIYAKPIYLGINAVHVTSAFKLMGVQAPFESVIFKDREIFLH